MHELFEKHDLVNKQIDADCNCKQLDSKLCDLIYLLVALIFCHIRRTIIRGFPGAQAFVRWSLYLKLGLNTCFITLNCW